jgi:hypothetical protein
MNRATMADDVPLAAFSTQFALVRGPADAPDSLACGRLPRLPPTRDVMHDAAKKHRMLTADLPDSWQVLYGMAGLVAEEILGCSALHTLVTGIACFLPENCPSRTVFCCAGFAPLTEATLETEKKCPTRTLFVGFELTSPPRPPTTYRLPLDAVAPRRYMGSNRYHSPLS